MLDKPTLIARIDEIRNCDGSERDEDALLEALEADVLDPQLSDYIYWSEMTSEEIATRVLAYRPIVIDNHNDHSQ